MPCTNLTKPQEICISPSRMEEKAWPDLLLHLACWLVQQWHWHTLCDMGNIGRGGGGGGHQTGRMDARHEVTDIFRVSNEWTVWHLWPANSKSSMASFSDSCVKVRDHTWHTFLKWLTTNCSFPAHCVLWQCRFHIENVAKAFDDWVLSHWYTGYTTNTRHSTMGCVNRTILHTCMV